MKENLECCDLNLIVTDFYDNLKNYLIGKIHNYELAEDIVQEVMLKVIKAHQKKVQIKNLKAWLFQIARNTLVDYYRKNANKIHDYEDYINDVIYDMQEDSFSPGHYIIPMINLLPSIFSHPLLLSDIENIPQAEIAQKMGLSLSATKMRIQRARKMLYDLFIECCDIKYTVNGAFQYCTIKQSCAPLKNL